MKYSWLKLPEMAENNHSFKNHMKLNDINVGRKANGGKFVNVCTEDANVVCYWMDEDCIFKQDWNLQLNNSSKF